MIHKYIGNIFGKLFIIFLRRNDTSKEFKDRLVSLLPIQLYRFNREIMLECFQVIRDLDYLNDYLFHEHFHILFWRRHKWFGVKGMHTIVNHLFDMKKHVFLIKIRTNQSSFKHL